MLDRPVNLTDEQVVAALRARWGIEAGRVEYAPVGYGGYHWTVEEPGGARWFVTADPRVGEEYGWILALSATVQPTARRNRGRHQPLAWTQRLPPRDTELARPELTAQCGYEHGRARPRSVDLGKMSGCEAGYGRPGCGWRPVARWCYWLDARPPSPPTTLSPRRIRQPPWLRRRREQAWSPRWRRASAWCRVHRRSEGCRIRPVTTG
jgi:hypothetical protein